MFIFDRSEEYRARLLLLLGGCLCTPFSTIALNWFTKNQWDSSFITSFVAAMLWTVGVLTIIQSYTIMEKRDILEWKQSLDLTKYH